MRKQKHLVERSSTAKEADETHLGFVPLESEVLKSGEA
jgi:hypothetical protein